MNEYLFGCGEGWLSKRVARIAKKHGAILVNHQDPQCKCGCGCADETCRAARRHWFAAPNLGEPHNTRLASAIENAIASI